MKNITWHKISNFFEHGDLTPFAVVISVAHYGPVLVEHGEKLVIAFLVGTLLDMIHFRTVRRLFQVRGSKRVLGHAAVAMLTTLMALGYHLRFYGNDLLLAAPIPIGIAILAQHAAANDEKRNGDKWRKRLRSVIAIARQLQKLAGEYQFKADRLQAQVNKLQEVRLSLQNENERQQVQIIDAQNTIRAWQSLNNEYQTLARFNADQITAEQAAQLIGVKDVRTVQARAEKLNGVQQ